MFKSEFLPSYEESQPQGGSSPSTPHTYTTPEMPGAEAGAGVEAGAGAEAGAGVPPPGTSTVIFPTYTSLEDIYGSDPSVFWENRSIRHAYVRKVYLILVLQLLVTNSIVAVFTFVDPVRVFVIQNPYLYGASLCVFLITYLVVDFCKKEWRQFPVNLILLFIFTLTMSFMAGTMSSFLETNLVVYNLVMMVVVYVTITVFNFQTKVGFPSCTGYFFVLFIVIFITVIPTLVIYFLLSDHHILYSFFWVMFYTMFQEFKIAMLLSKHRYDRFRNEYVFGALYLCTNIIIIFAFLLHIIILRSK